MACIDHADNCCAEWCRECQYEERVEPLRYDVIEAAKDVEEYLCELERRTLNYLLGKRLTELGKRVRALKAAEKGGEE